MKTKTMVASLLTLAIFAGCSTESDVPKKDKVNEDKEDQLPEGSFKNRLRGNDKGNGGDVVICFKSAEDAEEVVKVATDELINPFSQSITWNKVESVSLLDLVEYKLPSGLPPKRKRLMQVKGSHLDELPKLIEKLKKKSGLGFAIEKKLKEIPLSNWKKAGGVVSIDDSFQPYFLPTQCVIAQVAVRQDGFVFYDGFIFDHMSERNKLGLILHELIYAISEDSNSSDTRKVVGLALSESEWDETEILELRKKLMPVKRFSFPFDFYGKKVWTKERDEVRNRGYEYDFAFKDPAQIQIGDAKLQVRGVATHSFEELIQNKFDLMYGDMLEPLKAPEGSIHLKSGKVRSIGYSGPSEVSIGSYTIPGVRKVVVGEFLELVCDSGFPVSAETNFGTIAFSEHLKFSQNQLISGNIHSDIEIVSGSFDFYGRMELDQEQRVIFIESIANKHGGFVNISFGDSIVTARWAQGWFGEDGRFTRLKRGSSGGDPAISISSETFVIKGVEDVTLDSGGNIHVVKTSPIGRFKHKDATQGEFRDAPNETIVFNPDGSVQ